MYQEPPVICERPWTSDSKAEIQSLGSWLLRNRGTWAFPKDPGELWEGFQEWVCKLYSNPSPDLSILGGCNVYCGIPYMHLYVCLFTQIIVLASCFGIWTL